MSWQASCSFNLREGCIQESIFGCKEKRQTILITWVSVFLVLVGCTSHKALRYPSNTTLPDPYLLYEKIVSRCQTIHSLTGSAEVRLTRGNKAVHLEEIVTMKKPGSLRLETMDFWGQTIFVFIVHRGQWLTYSAADNQYAKDQAAIDEIKEFIGFAWDPEVMVRLLVGDPFYIGIQQPVIHISRDEGYFRLDVEEKDHGVRYLVWTGYGDLPVRSRLVTAPPHSPYDEGIEVEYGHYKTVDRIDFPFSFVISGPALRHGPVIEYDSVLINSSLKDEIFDFQPPQSMGQ